MFNLSFISLCQLPSRITSLITFPRSAAVSSSCNFFVIVSVIGHDLLAGGAAGGAAGVAATL